MKKVVTVNTVTTDENNVIVGTTYDLVTGDAMDEVLAAINPYKGLDAGDTVTVPVIDSPVVVDPVVVEPPVAPIGEEVGEPVSAQGIYPVTNSDRFTPKWMDGTHERINPSEFHDQVWSLLSLLVRFHITQSSGSYETTLIVETPPGYLFRATAKIDGATRVYRPSSSMSARDVAASAESYFRKYLRKAGLV